MQLGFPHWIPLGKKFQQGIQSRALEHHINRALENSVDVGDFVFSIKAITDNTNNILTLESREILNELASGAQELESKIISDTKAAIKATQDAESTLAQNGIDEALVQAGIRMQEVQKAGDEVGAVISKMENTENPTISKMERVENVQAEVKPLAEFGENFAEFAGDIKGAVQKLASEKKGQVASVFEFDGLGRLDLPYGKYNKETKKGYGLKKIIGKHSNDFEVFSGEELIEKIANGLDEILHNGKRLDNEPRAIYYKKGDDYFKVGIKNTFDDEEVEYFIVTAFNKADLSKAQRQELDSLFGVFHTAKKFNEPLTPSPTAEANSSTKISNENLIAETPTKTMADNAHLQELKAKAENGDIAELESFVKSLNEQEASLKTSAKILEREKNLAEFGIQKELNAGQNINQRTLERKEPIEFKETNLRASSVSVNDDFIAKMKYVIVKASDLKPNFEQGGTQFRTQAQEQVIQNISNNFKSELMIGREGFDGLPIILNDGQVISGNHRAQGIKEFTQENKEKYINAIKEVFGIELKGDEVLVRMPADNLSDVQINNLAMASNMNRKTGAGNAVHIALGMYANRIKNLNKQLPDTNIQEQAGAVAKALDTENAGANEKEANLALLAWLARDSANSNLAARFEQVKAMMDTGSAESLKKWKNFEEMFIQNAGGFYNLSNELYDGGLKALDFRAFLTDAIYYAGVALKNNNQKEAVQNLINNVKSELATPAGANEFLELNANKWNEIISQYLGVLFAKYARLSNPKEALFDFLKDARSVVENDFTNLFAAVENKNISQADIFDFIKAMAVAQDKTIKEQLGDEALHQSDKPLEQALGLLDSVKERYYEHINSQSYKDYVAKLASQKEAQMQAYENKIQETQNKLQEIAAQKSSAEQSLQIGASKAQEIEQAKNAQQMAMSEARAKAFEQYQQRKAAETAAQNKDSQADKIAQKQSGDEIVNLDKIKITDHIDFEQLQSLRTQTTQKLNQARKLEKIFTSADGAKAQIYKKGISKMTSDFAIKKSIANGFTPQQHFQAVNDLEDIFSKAKYAHSNVDESNPKAIIYRFNADLENMNVLLTLKEELDNGKKFYSLELENLEAKRFNPSGKDTNGFPSTEPGDSAAANTRAGSENDKFNSTTKEPKLSKRQEAQIKNIEKKNIALEKAMQETKSQKLKARALELWNANMLRIASIQGTKLVIKTPQQTNN